MKFYFPAGIALLALLFSCSVSREQDTVSQFNRNINWNSATVYFLLTDRFMNAEPGNDINFNRVKETGVNRGFLGGDLAGVTQKIREGYFTDLGVHAIWLTPFFEQIKGIVDEGTGETYGYHGYWISDWTALDPNFGTMDELAELVEEARKQGIRIVMDIVINHTGPVTPQDPVWPAEWVRTSPICDFQDYRGTVTCTLVENLPDIRTESESDVALPPQLLEKWEAEGRLEKELAELDAFFEETGYPRAPKYYIIKWLTDYIREFGISAYRLDTAKHTEEGVWSILRREVDRAYMAWKKSHNDMILDEDFYMVGEVYNYGASNGRWFDFGDTLVDFFAEGIDHLINFEFKYDASREYEFIFSKYDNLLSSKLKNKGIMNYLSSHDDGSPFDAMREKPIESATKLLLSPGAAQVYYGDETSRILVAQGAVGDANLRSFMNWEDLEQQNMVTGYNVSDVYDHYCKLGQFRKNHPAVGAGRHEILSAKPYYFKRTFKGQEKEDIVIVGLDLDEGMKEVDVSGIFDNGTKLHDAYSGITAKVRNRKASFNTPYPVLLIELIH